MGKRIYSFNQNFLSELNSPEKAYFLGLLYSDGCVFKSKDWESYSIIFGQSETNKDIVYKINNLLESTYPVQSSLRGSKLFYRIDLKSKQMFDDLQKLGIEPNKSLTCTFPILSDDLMPHFIRGLFDGDGCVWNGKRKIMQVKDSSKLSGYREKIVHNVKFTYTGNYAFVNDLQDYLVDKLGFKKTKLNFSKAKDSKHICTMEYSGRKQLKRFYDFIYKDATIYGDTKKLKFEEIFCALDGKPSIETVLTEETAEMPIVNQASQEEGSSTIPEMGVESSDSKCTAPNE